jgi:chromosome segregation ATPase
MHEPRSLLAFSALLAIALLSSLPYANAAQGKIVCWQDKSGKTIGCGDKVPPEFQGSATRELDSRGVTRGTTESVEDTNKRRLKEQDAARVKGEDERKSIEQKRHDTALLETYSNEKEIDLKRDRELQVIDSQIEQFNVSLKNATQRYSDTRSRMDALEKNKQSAGPKMSEDLAKADADRQRFEKNIAAKNQEKEALRKRYAEERARYIELRNNPGAIGSVPSSSAATSAK